MCFLSLGASPISRPLRFFFSFYVPCAVRVAIRWKTPTHVWRLAVQSLRTRWRSYFISSQVNVTTAVIARRIGASTPYRWRQCQSRFSGKGWSLQFFSSTTAWSLSHSVSMPKALYVRDVCSFVRYPCCILLRLLLSQWLLGTLHTRDLCVCAWREFVVRFGSWPRRSWESFPYFSPSGWDLD